MIISHYTLIVLEGNNDIPVLIILNRHAMDNCHLDSPK